jgi:hypothetical protein
MTVIPQAGADPRDEWDRLRFGQLLDTYRSLSASLASSGLGLIIGLVTILGFAVDRKSWGLAATALIFEVMLFVALLRFRRSATLLLDAAAALENGCCRDSSVVDAHRGLMSRSVLRGPLELAIIIVMLIHIGVTSGLAATEKWTFTGV